MKKYQRRSQSDWQSLVAEQRQSDLSAPAFCKDRDIAYASFISWRKKLAQPDAVSIPPATFLEITPAGTDSSPSSPPERSASIQPCMEIDIGPTMQLRIYSH